MPQFTIAVTTYDRPKLLRECIASILNQDFDDFEVIVGNDYVPCPISSEDIGADDERIRIINHPTNLGEFENMNAMLEMANGKYFTWLADDDAIYPNYFSALREILSENPEQRIIYPSYVAGETIVPFLGHADVRYRTLRGTDFLLQFMKGRIKSHGSCGVFETAFLRGIGGIKRMGTGFGPYSDTRMCIVASAAERVICIDTPSYFYRLHDGSASWSSPDLSAYATAQHDFLQDYKKRIQNLPNRRYLTFLIMRLFLSHIWAVTARSSMNRHKRIHYVGRHLRQLMRSPNNEWKQEKPISGGGSE